MKYFDPLFGNESARARLGNAIERGALPHAIMLVGKKGSGKHTFAMLMAAALACHASKDALPCGKCPECCKIIGGFSPDVSTVTKGERATIGVESVRAMRADMHLSPTELPFKFYIIEHTECMTEAAQNVLLIGIEEPPPNVYTVLLTESTENVLETVKSRVQTVTMQSFLPEELRRFFETHTEFSRTHATVRDTPAFSAALMEANGTVGGVLAYLSPERSRALLSLRASVNATMEAIVYKKRFTDLHDTLSPLTKKGITRTEYAEFLAKIRLALRDLTVRKRSKDAPLLYYADNTEVEKLAEGVGLSYLLSCHDTVADAEIACARNANLGLLTATLENDLYRARS